jgi:hypothetical protein
MSHHSPCQHFKTVAVLSEIEQKVTQNCDQDVIIQCGYDLFKSCVELKNTSDAEQCAFATALKSLLAEVAAHEQLLQSAGPGPATHRGGGGGGGGGGVASAMLGLICQILECVTHYRFDVSEEDLFDECQCIEFHRLYLAYPLQFDGYAVHDASFDIDDDEHRALLQGASLGHVLIEKDYVSYPRAMLAYVRLPFLMGLHQKQLHQQCHDVVTEAAAATATDSQSRASRDDCKSSNSNSSSSSSNSSSCSCCSVAKFGHDQIFDFHVMAIIFDYVEHSHTNPSWVQFVLSESRNTT